MTLAEAYANNCGVKLSDAPPAFPTNFFVTPQKYIVVHAGAGEKARMYDYWNIVVELIKPYLGSVEIVQIGTKDDPRVAGSLDYRDQTNFRQAGWIIEKAQAVMCSDSVWAHCAGMKNVPLVALYSINPKSCARPYYFNKDKTILLESHRNGLKPAYDTPEAVKTINLITPEDVAKAVLAVLEIPNNINITTKRLGADFNNPQIDFIPDFPIPPDAFNGRKIVCRLDLSYNLTALAQCLEFYRAFLVTNKTVPLKILQKYRHKLDFIALWLEKGYSKTFVEQIHKLGVPYIILTELKDKDLSDARLELFDFNPIFQKKEFDKAGLSEYDCYVSQRVFLSQNQFFSSVYHWRNGIAFQGEPQPIGEAFKDAEFWDSAESCWFYKKEEEVLHFD